MKAETYVYNILDKETRLFTYYHVTIYGADTCIISEITWAQMLRLADLNVPYYENILHP